MSIEIGNVGTQFAKTFLGELWSEAVEGMSNGSQVLAAAAAVGAVIGAAMAAAARTVPAIAVANQRCGVVIRMSSILSRREARLIQPLLARLQDAIDEVSAERGLAMVFAARANNAPIILYASDDAENITRPVMTALGLELPPESDDAASGGTGN